MYKIVAARSVGLNIKQFTILAPRIAAKQQPGQFLILRLHEKGERIPLTIKSSDPKAGLADAIERVLLPSPVTEKVVLHPSAHGVEAPVGDSDDVKGIGHTDRVIEMRAEPGSVGLRQISGDDLYALQPVLVGTCAPSAQVLGGIALDHVDHQLRVQIDQTGGVDDRVLPIGLKKRRLVDTEGDDWPHACRVLHKWPAVPL